MTEDYYDDGYDELEYKEFKNQMDSQAKHLQRWQAEQGQQASMAEQQKIFSEALKEFGLTQAQFNELVAKDPEGVTNDFKQGVRDYVGKVARRRDSKGRFVKQAPGRSEISQQRRSQPASRETLDKLHQTAKKRSLNEEEELSVLDALFGSDSL